MVGRCQGVLVVRALSGCSEWLVGRCRWLVGCQCVLIGRALLGRSGWYGIVSVF